MYNSSVRLPVPRTTRPVRMCGGGGASSKDGSQGSHTRAPPRTQSRRQLDEAASAPATATPSSSPAAQIGSPSTGPPPQLPPPPRHTITIFAELDEDGEDRAPELPGVSGARDGLVSIVPIHGPLSRAQTALTPLHYRSLCQSTSTSAGHATTPFLVGAPAALTEYPDPGRSGYPSGDVGEGKPDTCQGFHRPDVTITADPSSTLDSSMRLATATEGLSPSFGWSNRQADNSAEVDGMAASSLPVRLAACPVVTIVPHVTEPASRRRVAQELERRFGAAAATGGDSAASPSAGAATPPPSTTPEPAPQPPPTPKRKNSAVGFLTSSSSAGKKAAKAEVKKKSTAPPPPPLTAAERRQAREQIIRVGVQRLYQRLNELHLVVFRVRNDGNCQFRAISHQLFGNEDYNDIVRSEVVSYMRAARAESFDFYFESPAQADAYYDNLAKPGSWGDELSLRAASDCLYVNIHVLSSEERNCYITYRPSADRAAAAPSFLVDVWKLRERRRAERQLLRSRQQQQQQQQSYGSHMSWGDARCASSSFNGIVGAAGTAPAEYGWSTQRMAAAPRSLLVPQNRPAPPALLVGAGEGEGRDGIAAHNSRDDDDDDAEVDAHAMQLALHRRLQQSEIRCSRPLGTSSFGAMTSAHHSYSLGSPAGPPPPTRASLQQPAAVPVPRLAVNGSGGSTGQLDRFRAVGAEVQPVDTATQPVHIFTQHLEAAVHESGAASPTPALGTLLQPQQEGVTVMRNGGTFSEAPSLGAARRADPHAVPLLAATRPVTVEPGQEVMLLASSVNRARPNASLQHSFACLQGAASMGGASSMPETAQSSYAPSYTVGQGGLGCGPGTDAHSLGSLVPRNPSSSFAFGGESGSAHPAGCGDGLGGEPGVCFAFEPRTEPIDIFLSYLCPVHYNSLSIEQPSDNASVDTPAALTAA